MLEHPAITRTLRTGYPNVIELDTSCTCEICGLEYEEGTMHYDDTCDECARNEGLDLPENN